MAPFISLALMATSLLGAMSAPIIRVAPSEVATLSTQYSGLATLYKGDSIRGACPDVEYTNDELVVAMNRAQFGNVKNETSVCGKFVKVNRADDPSESFIYKVVDLCEDCDKNSLSLSENAIREFTNSDSVEIEWQLMENEDDETDMKDSQPTKKPAAKDENKDDSKNVSKAQSGATYRGRGTWFSDTMGSCGERFSQNEMIVALNEAQMGKMWGSGSKCGAKIRVSVKGSSKSVIVRVVDTCPHQFCSFGQLDLSQAAFQMFANKDVGILDLEWSFV
ncbi:hypothetical protein BGX28_002580 [Mortierella sp. GBA30]|nr:hypothetical protein BGX28_002580 [Mortierella sp. GBA30]